MSRIAREAVILLAGVVAGFFLVGPFVCPALRTSFYEKDSLEVYRQLWLVLFTPEFSLGTGVWHEVSWLERCFTWGVVLSPYLIYRLVRFAVRATKAPHAASGGGR